jgi:asparagine synthase (glutamine-hydrolysing)
MCGITGLINCGDLNTLSQMTEVVAHRGPDDVGVKWFENHHVGLGQRRLAIIDLSPSGHQPMADEKEELWITYNGELYNYRQIRAELIKSGCRFVSASDTEVILQAVASWGINSLAKFNGMFAFAVYNKTTKELFAARDRIGIKPFYYYHKDDKLIFASEIKAILKSGLVQAEPDDVALHTPTRFQISPLTGFKNIYKLPPGHYLVFKDGQLRIQPYWKLHPIENSIGDQDAEAQLEQLLFDAVELQMIADVPVGAFLSGGIDSSLICALMARHTNKTIKTFTIKFRQEDQKFESMGDDSFYARKIANHFGFDHHEFEIQPDIVDLLPKIIWHLDEPLADAAAINTYLISKAARENGIYVLLNGVGGDEIFGGYRKHLACLKAESYQKRVPKLLQASAIMLAEHIPVASAGSGFRSVRWAKRFLSFATLPKVERFLSSDLSLNPNEYQRIFQDGPSYWETHFYKSQAGNFNGNRLSYLTQMCLNDTLVFLPEHNLTYSDKATMAASVESRPPLTDHNIVEFMFSLPPHFRIRGNRQKYLLKKVAEKYLPREIVYRPKASFGTPLRSWIRGPLKEMIDDYLSYQSIQRRGFYEPSYIRTKIQFDRDGKEDNAHLIWQLLTNEIWFRTFFKM